MDFTTEEISLCKQIAEKYQRPLKCGDWILKNDKLVLNLDGKLAWSEDGKQDIIITITSKLEIIPLWIISDCLEFLREKGFRYDLEDYHVNPNDLIYVIMSGGKRNVNRLTFNGKTPLEACLKAVLAVLEDSSGQVAN